MRHASFFDLLRTSALIKEHGLALTQGDNDIAIRHVTPGAEATCPEEKRLDADTPLLLERPEDIPRAGVHRRRQKVTHLRSRHEQFGREPVRLVLHNAAAGF